MMASLNIVAMAKRTQRQARARLLNSGFLRSVTVLVGASAAAQLISMVAAPFLTRLYSPADFGLLAVFGTVATTAIVGSSLRFDLAIPITPRHRLASGLLFLSLTAVLVTAGIAAVIVHVYPTQIVSAVKTPALSRYLWLLPVTIAGGGVYQAASSWAVRQRRYKEIAATTVSQNIAMVVTQLGFSTLGPLGLIAGDVTGRVIGGGKLLWGPMRSGEVDSSASRLRISRAVAKIYWRYPVVSLPSGLLNTLALQLPTIVLAYVADPQTVGLFALTTRILSAPLTLVGRAAGQVFLGEASRRGQSDAAAIQHLFTRVTSRLFALALLPALVIALAGPELFGAVFGSRWHEAGTYARILAPVLVAQFTLAPVAQVLNLTGDLGLQLWWDLLRLVGVAAAMVVAGRFWGGTGAVAAYSSALTVLYLVLFFMYRRSLAHHARKADLHTSR